MISFGTLELEIAATSSIVSRKRAGYISRQTSFDTVSALAWDLHRFS